MRKTRGGWGETFFPPPPPLSKSRASYFRPPYYLRAWHRLMESRILGFGIRNTLKEFGIPLTIGIRNPVPGQNPEFKTVLESPLTWGDFLPKRKDFANIFFHTPQRAQMTKLISFQLSMHSGGLLSAQELDVSSYVYTIPYNFLCRHETLSDTVKKNNNNNKGSGLEQIVHTYGTSDRCGWPRGFCELNIPVLSSEYFLPCQLVPVLAPTYSRSRSTILQSDHLFTLHQSVAQNLSDM